MRAEGLPRDGVVVLRAHGEDDAAAPKVERHLLYRAKRFPACIARTQSDSVEAIIADHSTPQGVVEIEYQALAGAAAQGGQRAANEVGVKGQQCRSTPQARDVPLPVVVPLIEADEAREPFEVDQRVAALGCLSGQL